MLKVSFYTCLIVYKPLYSISLIILTILKKKKRHSYFYSVDEEMLREIKWGAKVTQLVSEMRPESWSVLSTLSHWQKDGHNRWMQKNCCDEEETSSLRKPPWFNLFLFKKGVWKLLHGNNQSERVKAIDVLTSWLFSFCQEWGKTWKERLYQCMYWTYAMQQNVLCLGLRTITKEGKEKILISLQIHSFMFNILQLAF